MRVKSSILFDLFLNAQHLGNLVIYPTRQSERAAFQEDLRNLEAWEILRGMKYPYCSLLRDRHGVQPDKLAITLASTKKYGLLVINMNKQGGIKLFISTIKNIAFLWYTCSLLSLSFVYCNILLI